jgi:hypothetical protein
LAHKFEEKFDMGICLQVLEHLEDPKIFVKKIFDLCNTVIISVPYKWPEDSCEHHIHDEIDEKKLFEWTSKIPIEANIVDNRLIVLYKQPKKVLIVVISDTEIGSECMDAILNQDYPNFTTLTSIVKPDPNKLREENIIINRNIVRKKALKTDANYFFLVDSDVILPKNALSNLMIQLEQPILDTRRFQHLEKMFGKIENKKKHIIGGWYKLTEDTWSPSRWVADNTLVSLKAVEPSVVVVDKIALGCIVMSKEVLKKIKFRTGHDLVINGDTHPCMCATFGIDAQDAGYTLYMDGSVICQHLKQLKNDYVECFPDNIQNLNPEKIEMFV